MTKRQQIISRYIQSINGTNLEPYGESCVTFEDANGQKKTYGMCLYGDIYDISTRLIVAMSDLPHGGWIAAFNPCPEPNSWKVPEIELDSGYESFEYYNNR